MTKQELKQINQLKKLFKTRIITKDNKEHYLKYLRVLILDLTDEQYQELENYIRDL